MRTKLIGVLAVFSAIAGPAAAEDLVMGFDSEWSSVDPHYHSFPQNLSVVHHVFDALVEADVTLTPQPQLAVSWRAIDDVTWEFKLREGVKFHDGSDFDAADVAASITRVPNVPDSPGSLAPQVRAIERSEVVDDTTIIFHLSRAEPILPILLTDIHIIPSELEEATTEQFNTGEAMIGTGPYKFGEWRRGDRVTLTRNENYWGKAPAWENVDIRVLTNAASREAALLSGEVDFIQNPSTASLPRLEEDADIKLHQAASTRISYIQFHQGKDVKADLTSLTGENPFADPRVREAFSLAIPREAIAERIMDGLSLPASQLVAPGYLGHNPAIEVKPYDPERAKELLTEAGYPEGFTVAYSTPNDRNINGVAIAETIAASLARIGVTVNVNAVPLSVWVSEWRDQQYSMVMHGAGPPPATILLLAQLAGTKDDTRALGRSNESYYSNPELDDLLVAIASEFDEAELERLINEATIIIEAETAVIPLHHEVVVWATRADLEYEPRADARTWAMSVTPSAE